MADRITSYGVSGVGFTQFCLDTTLHGWYYLGRPKGNLFQRLYWSLVVLASYVVLGLLVYTAAERYFNTFILITISDISAPLENVLFPAMVICNLNRARKSFILDMNLTVNEFKILQDEFIYGRKHNISAADQNFIEKFLASEVYNKEIDKLMEYYENLDINPREFIDTNAPVLDIFTLLSFVQMFNSPEVNSHRYPWKPENTFEEIKKNKDFFGRFRQRLFRDLSSHDRADMLTSVTWPGKQVFLSPNFGTDIGICTSLAPIVHDETEWSDVPSPFGTWVQAGVYPSEENGVAIILDGEKYDQGPSKSTESGFRTTFFHYLDVPLLGLDAVNLEIGSKTTVAISPSLFNTTLVAKDRFTPHERKCYFQDEIRLADINADVGGRYGMVNCLLQAVYDLVNEECRCDPAYYVVTSKPICRGKTLACYTDVKKQLGKHNIVNNTLNGVKSQCLAACEMTFYTDQLITTAQYPNEATYMYTEDSCIIARKLLKRACKDSRRHILNQKYPDICEQLEYLYTQGSFCVNKVWNYDSLDASSSSYNSTQFKTNLIRYAVENTAKLNAYIRKPFANSILVDEAQSTISFISNLGGIMGLCMGFSIVTMAELLYHVILGTKSILLNKPKVEQAFERRELRESYNSKQTF